MQKIKRYLVLNGYLVFQHIKRLQLFKKTYVYITHKKKAQLVYLIQKMENYIVYQITEVILLILDIFFYNGTIFVNTVAHSEFNIKANQVERIKIFLSRNFFIFISLRIPFLYNLPKFQFGKGFGRIFVFFNMGMFLV